jgi:hypothetical protein
VKPDDDLTTLFRNLEPIEAQPEFLRALREIPLRDARASRSPVGARFWDFRFGIGALAALLLGVWLGTTDWILPNASDDVVAFMDLDTGEVQDEPFDLGLLE